MRGNRDKIFQRRHCGLAPLLVFVGLQLKRDQLRQQVENGEMIRR